MIGVFDSGEGGLSVLKEITRLLPTEKYIYYSDNAYCPYGEKTPEFIQNRARAITDTLLEKGADIIVVACNTATAAAISVLRAEYPSVKFIGMEPAVKPAALGTVSGTIGVLATAGTLKGSKYLKTKESVDDHVNVVEHVGRGFVELVEEGKFSGPEVESVVSASLKPLLETGADIIVLGCTHYPFLRPHLREFLGNRRIEIIDGSMGTAKELKRRLAEKNLLHAEKREQQIIFENSMEKQEMIDLSWKLLRLPID